VTRAHPIDSSAPRERRLLRKIGWAACFALLAVVVYLLVAPTRVEPASWPRPEAAPLEGPFAANELLREHRAIATGTGPEDVAIAGDGRMFTGLADGRVLVIDGDAAPRTWCTTGGRPLGLAFAPDGALWIADARKGLLRTDDGGAIVQTIDHADDGSRIGLADELVFTKAGTVWFPDPSTRWDVEDSVPDALENQATGRVLHHDPRAGTTEVVFDELRFANGIVLADDEQSLLVAETFAYRVTRLWIDGPKKGTREPFTAALPGFVDNLDLDANGTLWIGIPSLRSGLLDALLPHPWLRRVLSRVPLALQPVPPPYGLILGVGPDGAPRFALHDPQGDVFAITSATPLGDELVLGSLKSNELVRIARPRP
jgi:sugar lactone lactonase YvrE